MSYTKDNPFRTVPPWRTRYAIPEYIAEDSPTVFPNWSPDEFPMGALGATARPLIGQLKSKFPTGMQLKERSIKLPEGPRVQLGPLSFGIKGGSMTIPRKWFESQAGLPTQHYIGARLGEVMRKWTIPCMMSTTQPTYAAQTGGGCLKSYKGWGVSTALPIRLWKGKIPLLRTRPKYSDGTVAKDDYVLFARFEENKIHLTFKKHEKGLFEKIWDFITAVVSKIIDTIGELLDSVLDLLKAAACLMAEPAMKALMAYATGGIGLGVPPTKPPDMSAEEYAMLSKGWGDIKRAGIKNSDIAKLRKGATTKLATDMSNQISKSLCGGKDVVAPPASTLPGWVWPVAIVGGVGAIALVLTR